jgi:hypothetical protein
MNSENRGCINNLLEFLEKYTEFATSNSTESFIKSIKITKSFKYFMYILIPLTFFYLFGFIFNNLQNPNRLFSSAWFFDSLILSWTNLFILPILILITVYGVFRKIEWKVDFLLFIFLHLLSPFLWIAGYLVLRIFVKTVDSFSNLISEFLTYLAD